jgi:hypothetical protein
MSPEIIDYLIAHSEGLKSVYITVPNNFRIEFKEALEDVYFDKIKMHLALALNLTPEEVQTITIENIKSLLGNDFFKLEE